MDKKLEIAKKIIKKHYSDADCGIFNSRNFMGDPMTTIYNENGLTIDICYSYSYFEVFGLNFNSFQELKRYYYSLEEEMADNETLA